MKHADKQTIRFSAYISRLFQKPAVPDSWKTLAEGRRSIGDILKENRFIARSELENVYTACREPLAKCRSLKQEGLLKSYAKKYHIDLQQLEQTIAFFECANRLRLHHNREFLSSSLVSRKTYLDHILDEIDPEITLDEQQRRMVLNDEDYCLVIAGAGAGKTTSVAAKVKYLVEVQHIDPGEILVISFTNKAVRELRTRIQKNLALPVRISTFHSVGNAILRRDNPDKVNIADPSLKYTAIMAYFQRQILRDESMVHRLIMFFSYYLEPLPGSDPEAFFRAISLRQYTTLRSELGEIHDVIRHARNGKTVTIQNEIVRSFQEVEIANFLYLHGLDYEYEPLYPYTLPGSRKPYTPDFIIKQDEHVCYLEHFGLSEDGENGRYTPEELSRYKSTAHAKVALHRQHGTGLICTFSSYRDHRPLTAHLEEQLEKHGFRLEKRSEKEILEKLLSQSENSIVSKFVLLITRFISGFKTDGYGLEDFDRMKKESRNVRTDLFLDICRACYLEYERVLLENHATDFEDMINESAKILRQMEKVRHGSREDGGHEVSFPDGSVIPCFRYVIVDEYQDISRQRFDLVTAIRNATGAKIIAVGDDWQSIYAFSGSDITLFTQFKEKMGYASLLKIENTYRNSQEVIDIAGGFIQKNSAQIIKTLQSPKNITDPVVMITYDSGRKEKQSSGALDHLAEAVEHALDEIVAYHGGQTKNLSILVLGRFGFDGYNLSRSELFTLRDYGSRIISGKYPTLQITFMTAHASKGLGYDDVILLNARDDRYGFPSQIEDDPVLSLVYRQDRSYAYAEERRLFYVAMTRTKNRVWMIVPEQQPSIFVMELLADYKNIRLEGKIQPQKKVGFTNRVCPLCGYPLKLRFKKSIGLPLYLCSNEPEICGFMTNNIKGGTLQIQKCDCCNDGYLIVRENSRTGQMFLGCTNYRRDGRGCNRSI